MDKGIFNLVTNSLEKTTKWFSSLKGFEPMAFKLHMNYFNRLIILHVLLCTHVLIIAHGMKIKQGLINAQGINREISLLRSKATES